MRKGKKLDERRIKDEENRKGEIMRKRTVESRGQERYQGKEGRKRRGKERGEVGSRRAGVQLQNKLGCLSF